MLRRDHRLSSSTGVSLVGLRVDTAAVFPRGEPGRLDAVLSLRREEGVEPQVMLRTRSFDLT